MAPCGSKRSFRWSRRQADGQSWDRSGLLKSALSRLFFRSTQILGFLVTTAIRKPKLAIAVVLVVLAALAGTMTYTGYLVIGVLADHLGTGRIAAGLLLGVLLARVPWISQGQLRIVGLLPKPVRRPVLVSLLVLCSLDFVSQGEYVSAAFTGFATAFLLAFPWLRRAVFDRTLAPVFKFARRHHPESTDGMVIDGEFREKKE